MVSSLLETTKSSSLPSRRPIRKRFCIPPVYGVQSRCCSPTSAISRILHSRVWMYSRRLPRFGTNNNRPAVVKYNTPATAVRTSGVPVLGPRDAFFFHLTASPVPSGGSRNNHFIAICSMQSCLSRHKHILQLPHSYLKIFHNEQELLTIPQCNLKPVMHTSGIRGKVTIKRVYGSNLSNRPLLRPPTTGQKVKPIRNKQQALGRSVQRSTDGRPRRGESSRRSPQYTLVAF